MPCQICGKYSSFYPLCMKHNQMREQGEVRRCSDCSIWYLGTDEKCSNCQKGTVLSKSLIHINKEAFVKWTKTLFSIGKTGESWNEKNEPELRRYKIILAVSGEMHVIHTESEDSLVGIEKEVIEKWSKNLYDLAKDGLKKTQNNHDVKRYNDVLEVQQQVISTIEAASEDYGLRAEDDIGESKEERSGLRVDFISDREIMYKMLEMINDAKRAILIASPWIWESREVLDALKKAADERYIGVRIITRPAEHEQDEKHKTTVTALHRLGFQIEHDKKVHAKLLLIDDTELLIGSANLVGTSMIRNHEVALSTNDPKTVRDATNYFNDLINDIFSKKFDKVEQNRPK